MLSPRIHTPMPAVSPGHRHDGTARTLSSSTTIILLTLATSLALPAAAVAQSASSSAMAQDQRESPSRPAAKPAARMSSGVVTPKGDIDPGMTTRPPAMPLQSTPVIHPPATGNDGSVVVPR